MNLDYLTTYINVVKTGSYSQAAKKLFFSQPGVSFQIRKLEQELGLKLIDYRKKTIFMTEAGKRLFRFAEYVYREQLSMQHDLEQLQQELTGNLFITTSHIPGEFILPAIFGAFKEQYPGVGIKVIINDSYQVIADVKNDTFEVGFCSLVPEGADLEYFKIAEDEIVLIVSPGHSLSHQKEVSLEELAGETYVMREEPSERQHAPGDMLLKAGFDISQSKTRLVLGTNIGVVSAVEAGAGIAFMSNLAVRKSEALGSIKILKIKGITLKRDYLCIYKKNALTSRIPKEFITLIREKITLRPI